MSYRKTKPYKFDFKDVHDRTCLFYLLAYVVPIFSTFETEIHPITSKDEYIAIGYALLIGIILAPHFFQHFTKHLAKQCEDCSGSDFTAVLGFCGGCLFLISIAFNYLYVLFANSNFDYSTPVTRYVLVTRTEDLTYVVTDWTAPKRIKKIKVKKNYSQVAGRGDVLRIKTKPGFLGLEYMTDLNSMKAYPIEEFSDNTIFPITEEEFQKIHIEPVAKGKKKK